MVSQLSPATELACLNPSSLLTGYLVALLGLSLGGNPGVTAAPPWLTFLLGGAGLSLVALHLWKVGCRPWPRLTLLAILLCLFGLLSTLAAPSGYLSRLGLASLFSFLGVVAGLETGINSKAAWRQVASALLLLCCLSSLHGLVEWQQQGGQQALRSTFTNQDCYSVIPLIGLFLALGLAIEAQGWIRLLPVAACIPLLSALLLTASRAGLLGLLIGYLAFLFTLSASRSQALRTLAVKLFLIPTTATLFLVGSGSSLPLVEKLSRLSQGADPVSLRSRWDVVRVGLKTAARHPLTGSGIGCFHLAYQQDRPATSAGEDYMNVAHNDYMQWAIETGFGGLLCFLALLGTGLGLAWSSFRAPTPWVAAQVGSLSALASYCCFNFACPVPSDFLWLGACLGLSGSLSRLQLDPSSSKSWDPKIFPPIALLVAAGLWTGHQGWSQQRLQSLVGSAEQASGMLDWEGAIEKIQLALRQQPDDFKLQLRLAEQAHRAFLFSGEDQWLQLEDKALQAAHSSNPLDLEALLSLARFLQEQQRAKEASRYVALAEKAAPYSPNVRKARAINQIWLGDFEPAAKTLAEIERQGEKADDQALAVLISFLENRGPQQGSAFLKKVSSLDPERAVSLGLAASREALKQKDFASSIRLLSVLRYLSPKRAEILLELASVLGQARLEDRQLKVLDKLRRDPDLDIDDELREKVWKQWAELQLRQGQLDLIIAQLEDYLISHQRLIWPRLLLTQIYLKRNQQAEARGILREGLGYDQKGVLRIQLGDLCAKQGLTDLARSYYKEALGMSDQKSVVEAKLKALRQESDFPEELELP